MSLYEGNVKVRVIATVEQILAQQLRPFPPRAEDLVKGIKDAVIVKALNKDKLIALVVSSTGIPTSLPVEFIERV